MRCCRKSAVSLVLMAVQGELTNLSGKSLTSTTEERGEGKGKKQN